MALRTWDHSESARLADEAVNLDPNLIWVYAAAGTYYVPSFDPRRLSALEQWDPQNAVPHLIVAERIDLDQVERAKIPHRVNEEPAAWRDAMAAAFQSPKLDTYVEQQKQLDRRVLARYLSASTSERRTSGTSCRNAGQGYVVKIVSTHLFCGFTEIGAPVFSRAVVAIQLQSSLTEVRRQFLRN